MPTVGRGKPTGGEQQHSDAALACEKCAFGGVVAHTCVKMRKVLTDFSERNRCLNDVLLRRGEGSVTPYRALQLL